MTLSGVTQQLAQQRTAVQSLQPPATSAVSQILQTLGTADRSVIAEVTGTDRVGQVSLLRLILLPPPSNEE